MAWVSRGPAWLPAEAAEVCSRCLAAATPFSESLVSVAIPAVLPLVLPLLGFGVAAAGLWREFSQLRQTRHRLTHQLRESHEATVLGHRVSIMSDDSCFAYSLPRRAGGIVLSRGAVASLSPAELAAVLQHEEAHLRQRHHLLLALLGGVTHYFRRVPLIQACATPSRTYLEIAADQSAKRVTGTAVLAGALLKLRHLRRHRRRRACPIGGAARRRIERVAADRCAPATSQHRTGRAAGAYTVMLLTAIVSVNTPYLLAVVAGC